MTILDASRALVRLGSRAAGCPLRDPGGALAEPSLRA